MKLFLLVAAGVLQLGFGTAATAHTTPPTRPERTLEFVENKGQWDERARYVAALPGGRLFAEPDGLTFSLLASGSLDRPGHGAHKERRPAADSLLHGHALTLRFEGAAPATITPAEATEERRNYFLGQDPTHWATGVRGFRELRYAGLWPGVNARVYESTDQHLEYDFEVAPGARPEAIALRHDGATGLTLDAEGNLLVRTSVGTLVERAPQAWQTTARGRRRAVACRYMLTDGTVRFALGRYDQKLPLVIDPVVVFASYTGSTADNWGFTATYDTQGNLYSGGIVFSLGYPASPGAFRTQFSGVIDIGVIKYQTSVSGPAARVWASYIGGGNADFPTSLVVNSQGELLLLGASSSNNYPTTAGALQRTFNQGFYTDPYGYGFDYALPNGSDLVITRFNANGTGLVGSTYLGGSGNEGVLPLNVNTTAQLAHNYGDPFRGDILVDAADNVYVASNTSSSDFPLARGFNTTYRGGATDGLVLKLNPTLTALTWGSYLGGGASDAAYSIQVEPTSGDVYVTGGTLSSNFPTTAGSLRPAALGDVDGFVARISASGTGLLRASYLGTPAYDQSYFLQLGTDGGVYVLGQTAGAYPTTPGLFVTPNGRQFIHKLDPNLGTTQLATVFGSGRNSIDLDPTAFLVDRCDRVYVCGWGGVLNDNLGGGEPYLALNGTTAGLPVTPGALQPNTDANDFYLVQFAAGLGSLAYATYYGDTTGTDDHVDGGTARFDPRGVVYQAVCACGFGSGFPIPPGANTYSTFNPSGNCNNAAFVFNFEPSIANAGADQTVCATAGPQPLVGNPTGGTWSGPGVTGSLATGFFFTPSAALVGVQSLTYTVLSSGLCTTTGTRRVTVTAPPTVAITAALASTYCTPGINNPALPVVPLTAAPAGGVWSGSGVINGGSTGFYFNPNSAPGTYQVVYTLSVGGCVVQDSRTVAITRPVAPVLPADTVLCPGSTQRFALRGSPAGGVWTGTGVTGSPATGFFFTPPAGFVGPATLSYAVSSGGCSASATRRVSVAAVPTLTATAAPVPCPEARLAPLTLRFTAGAPAAGTSLSWDFGDGTQSTETTPTHTYTTPGKYQPVARLRYNGDRCETQLALPAVTVLPRKIPNIITPNGDPLNETFKLGPDCPPRLQIFSRWGQKVFEAAAYRDDWRADGQPDGVYYYLITYPDGRQLKGMVEVVR
ncbi:gliding motility-associated C-terminal domain-containing protein [Hymenobacter armeniacus]|uniref:Gliding motility-associated C-terminal domain-containing protein n=1 Tax=Hymenobacter armeniacus TaxID=2771358 RepID=A0ABR8K0V9_9BACT|nr:gliding motility-associated C-terminal domain-containing protein [Hymenobacter armeniacus]MBD2724697.1 gliding motility-associated C-terminal domain-containing protein [Hymenobacter armeniacus]